MSKVSISKPAVACLFSALLVACLVACGNDPYDTGDGSLSYMRADFVEVSTNSSAEAVSAVSDDGKILTLSPAIGADWLTAKDSVYRALLYYNVAEGMDAELVGEATVKPIAVGNVIVPNVINASSGNRVYPVDPVNLESMWMSKNGRYLNLDISVKVGAKDGKIGSQSIGVAYVGSYTGSDGSVVHRLVFAHGQNGVPEYYSSQAYVSIPLYRMPYAVTKADRIEITVNDYDGKATKTFVVE